MPFNDEVLKMLGPSRKDRFKMLSVCEHSENVDAQESKLYLTAKNMPLSLFNFVHVFLVLGFGLSAAMLSKHTTVPCALAGLKVQSVAWYYYAALSSCFCIDVNGSG